MSVIKEYKESVVLPMTSITRGELGRVDGDGIFISVSKKYTGDYGTSQTNKIRGPWKEIDLMVTGKSQEV